MALKEYKPEKLLYSMGEVTEMFDVKPSLIRFWEQRFDILKPKKNKKGNRLFTPADVKNLEIIYHLTKERGMTLAGVEKYLKNNKEQAGKDTEIVRRLQTIRALLVEIREELKEDREDEVRVFTATHTDGAETETDDTVIEPEEVSEPALRTDPETENTPEAGIEALVPEAEPETEPVGSTDPFTEPEPEPVIPDDPEPFTLPEPETEPTEVPDFWSEEPEILPGEVDEPEPEEELEEIEAVAMEGFDEEADSFGMRKETEAGYERYSTMPSSETEAEEAAVTVPLTEEFGEPDEEESFLDEPFADDAFGYDVPPDPVDAAGDDSETEEPVDAGVTEPFTSQPLFELDSAPGLTDEQTAEETESEPEVKPSAIDTQQSLF